ncbi:VOC family protein [Paenibacillus sp. P26]|nr:VOC family protein [Paenibacillus sp. P26]UUZ91576.1 VOC family protein [Paenibacillus sp. P25]
MNEPTTNEKEWCPHWQGFHHLALVTPDLDGTIRFYEKMLGMRAGTIYPAAKGRGRHCFVKPGETESWGIHFFEYPEAEIFQSDEALRRLAANPQSPDLFRFLPGALQHIAFSLPSEEEGLALRNKLHQAGIAMTGVYDQGRIRNFIFTDNNGIQVEAAWPKE